MFQILGNRCHFNTFNKDMTFWIVCLLLPPNLAWPTGIACLILASNHTALTDLHHSPSASSCCLHQPSKIQIWTTALRLGWVEVRWASGNRYILDTCQLKQTKPKTFFSLKLHWSKNFILTIDQITACNGKVVVCCDEPTENHHLTSVALSSMQRFRLFQLILFFLQAATLLFSFTLATFINHISRCFQ